MNQEETKNLAELIARVDERTKAIQNNIENARSDVKIFHDTLNQKIIAVATKSEADTKEQALALNNMRSEFDAKLKVIEEKTVSKSDFEPIKRFVYGLVALVLIVVLSSILGTVVAI